jgi:hypothetical protein
LYLKQVREEKAIMLKFLIKKNKKLKQKYTNPINFDLDSNLNNFL